MPAGSGFGFGPFQLDLPSKRLLCANAEVRLTSRQFAFGPNLSRSLSETLKAGRTRAKTVARQDSQIRRLREQIVEYLRTARAVRC